MTGIGILFSNDSHFIEIEGNYIFFDPLKDANCPFIVYWKNGSTSHYSALRVPCSNVPSKMRNIENDYWVAEAIVRDAVLCEINQ